MLMTIPQMEALSNRVGEELDIISLEYVSEANEIMSSDDTYVTKLEKLNKLSNRLVKVRTQSDMTKKFKEARNKVKEVQDLLRTSEASYIDGIRKIESDINKPLQIEKERKDNIKSYLETVTKELENISDTLVNTPLGLSVSDLKELDTKAKEVFVLPEFAEERDNVSFDKYTESLYENVIKTIESRIVMQERIEELEASIPKEEQKEEDSILDVKQEQLLESVLDIGNEDIQEIVKDEDLGVISDYARNIIRKSSNKELLTEAYTKMKKSCIVADTISIDTALSIFNEVLDGKQWRVIKDSERN